MRTFLTTTALSVGFVVAAGAASAATWDFGSDAHSFRVNDGFEGTFDQVYNDSDSSLYEKNTQDGITVNAFALDHDDGPFRFGPFMDSKSGGQVAGLGVCSTGFDTTATEDGSGDFGGMSRCSTQYSGSPSDTSDDNLVFGEILALTFDAPVQLTELLLKDADHDGFAAEHGIVIMTSVDEKTHPDDVNYFSVLGDGNGDDGFGVVQDLASLGFSDVFFFTSAFKCEYPQVQTRTISDEPEEPKCSSGPEIYLSSLTATEIPLPAAGWMLIAGIGGLAAMRRRKS